MILDPISAAVVRPASSPSRPTRCGSCPALTRAQTAPQGAPRCAEADGRLISWYWLPSDAAPPWCPIKGRVP